MAIYNIAWGVAILPLLGALTSLLAETQRRAVQVCVAFSGAACALSAAMLGLWLSHAYATPYQNFITFFGMNPPEGNLFAARFEPFFGIHVDALSAAFCFVVSVAVLAVQAYALTSLRGDEGYRRFAWTSSLVSFATLSFVLSPNLFQALFTWLLASAGFYLMTLHWWRREDAAAPARRLFIALHIGDVALLLAVVFVFAKFGIFAATLPAPANQDISDPFSFSVIAQTVSALVTNHVTLAGPRTLAVLASVLVFAAVARAGQVPFQVWLGEAATSPVPVIAMATGIGGTVAVFLLARLYPILLITPHAATALALTAGVSAILVGLVCVAQRDVMRIATLSAVVQLALAFIALSGGGYSQGLFVAFTTVVFSTLVVLAAGNLVRVYRTRNLLEMGGAWRRMRTTSWALVVWAAGVGGLALQSYYALNAAFSAHGVTGETFGPRGRVAVAVLTLIAALVMTLAACRLVMRVCFGEPEGRRGFRPERIVEVEPPLRLVTSLLTAGAVLAVIVGLPGISGAGSGRTRVPALSFIHFIVFGLPEQTAFDPQALLLSLLVLALGATAAVMLFSPRRRAVLEGAQQRFAPLVQVFSHDLYMDRAAHRIGLPLRRAGSFVDRFDGGVLDTLAEAAAQGAALSVWGAGRLRTSRSQLHLAGGVALVALLLLLSVLAATGHLVVHTT